MASSVLAEIVSSFLSIFFFPILFLASCTQVPGNRQHSMSGAGRVLQPADGLFVVVVAGSPWFLAGEAFLAANATAKTCVNRKIRQTRVWRNHQEKRYKPFSQSAIHTVVTVPHDSDRVSAHLFF